MLLVLISLRKMSLTLFMLDLVRSFSHTPLASFNEVFYTPDATISEEFQFHS